MEDRIHRLIKSQTSLDWLPSFLREQPRAQIFLVGGAVRDAFLQLPTKDFDFVISGLTTKSIEQWFGGRGKLDFVGTHFGVYKFLPVSANHPSEEIDIALPRTEAASTDNHGGYREFVVEARVDLPIEMDLARRDFTVNAMAYDLRRGTLIDPYKGLRDLKAKVVRAVGVPSERLQEDLTRLLRAIRFSCLLGFHIEEHTWNAIHDLAPRINFTRSDDSWIVPREAVGREFLKSYLHDPACTLIKYDVCGLFALLFSEFDPRRAMTLVSDATGLSPRLLVALLLSTAELTAARSRAEEYRFYQFPKNSRLHIDLEEVLWLVRSAHALDLIEDPEQMRGSIFEKMFMGTKGAELLSLIHLTGSAPEKKIEAVKKRLQHLRSTLGDEIPELLNGDDLIKAGVKPGPQFRELLNKIRDAQFTGTITSKDEASDYLASLL